MRFKKSQLKKVVLSLTLSLGAGFTTLAALADEIIVPGYTLSSDVVQLVDTNGKILIGEDGRLVSTSGKVVGVVTSPEITVVQEVPVGTTVTIAQAPHEIMAASLYNRISALKGLAVKETALGHVPKDNFEKVNERLNEITSEVNGDVKSGGKLSFKEAVKAGEQLDQVAYSLKRKERGVLLISERVLEPMVIDAPSGKRLSIFTHTVTSPDGVKTTETTKTETTF